MALSDRSWVHTSNISLGQQRQVSDSSGAQGSLTSHFILLGRRTCSLQAQATMSESHTGQALPESFLPKATEHWPVNLTLLAHRNKYSHFIFQSPHCIGMAAICTQNI